MEPPALMMLSIVWTHSMMVQAFTALQTLRIVSKVSSMMEQVFNVLTLSQIVLKDSSMTDRKCIDNVDYCVEGYFNDGSDDGCVSSTKHCAEGFFNDGTGLICVDTVSSCLAPHYFSNG